MALFGKKEQIEEKKSSLFDKNKEVKNNEDNQKEVIQVGNAQAESAILFGGSRTTEPREPRGGSQGDNGGDHSPINRSRGEGNQGGGNQGGVFTFSPANERSPREIGGEDRGSGQTATGTISDEVGTTRQADEGGKESASESKLPARSDEVKKPSLDFGGGSAAKDEKEQQEIKIQKRRGRTPKTDSLLSEEQVEILFTGLFDGIALFRGQYWKLTKDELSILPALTRILNRMVEALPIKYSKHAFNFMDYAVVLGGIGAIIMTRVKMEKEVKQNGKPTQQSKPIPNRDQGSVQPATNPMPNPTQQSERIQDGKTFLSPINDLAQSINRIS